MENKNLDWNDPEYLYAAMTLKHIYNTSGFAISAKFTEDGKEYKPTSRHACMRYGYFCTQQLRENPASFIDYLIVNRKEIAIWIAVAIYFWVSFQVIGLFIPSNI